MVSIVLPSLCCVFFFYFATFVSVFHDLIKTLGLRIWQLMGPVVEKSGNQ